jgi:hypothetical protein
MAIKQHPPKAEPAPKKAVAPKKKAPKAQGEPRRPELEKKLAQVNAILAAAERKMPSLRKKPHTPLKPAKPTKRRTTPPIHKPGAKTGAGRPSKWQDEYCEQAYKLTLLGWGDKQLAEFWHIDEKTLNSWKHIHPEFLQSITEGKGPADGNVAHSLYKRAIGYSHDDVDIRTLSHGLNASAELVITPIVKHYPPDTAAASLWLRNRANKLWKEKNQTEVSGPNDGPIQNQNVNLNAPLTPDEAYRLMLNKPPEA